MSSLDRGRRHALRALVINYDQATPLFEGVEAVLLTAMSLLAFLARR